jgi:hypothetical protein
VIVVWGNNRFIDCVTLVGWKDEIVLSMAPKPLRIDMKTPTSGMPKKLRIVANEVIESTYDKINVASTATSISVVLGDSPLLMAQDVGDDRVLLHTDFRPVGMNIFSDAAGLHVGASSLGGNVFEGFSIAISLG